MHVYSKVILLLLFRTNADIHHFVHWRLLPGHYAYNCAVKLRFDCRPWNPPPYGWFMFRAASVNCSWNKQSWNSPLFWKILLLNWVGWVEMKFHIQIQRVHLFSVVVVEEPSSLFLWETAVTVTFCNHFPKGLWVLSSEFKPFLLLICLWLLLPTCPWQTGTWHRESSFCLFNMNAAGIPSQAIRCFTRNSASHVLSPAFNMN